MNHDAIRLRLATRIHFALLRQYDEDVPVDTLLRGGPEADEALWVCDASGITDLRNLAVRFRAASQPDAHQPAGGARDTEWASTTVFASTNPSSTNEMPPLQQPGWKHPLRWLLGTGR